MLLAVILAGAVAPGAAFGDQQPSRADTPNAGRMQSPETSPPSDIRAQLRAEWNSLSDEERARLKKMSPGALRQRVAHYAEQVVQQLQAALRNGRTSIRKAIGLPSGLEHQDHR